MKFSIECVPEYTQIRYAVFLGTGRKNGLESRNKGKDLAEIHRFPSTERKLTR
jgi:hypothetical protein